MTTIRTLEITFEKSIKSILYDFMSRLDYRNFSESFDEGLYYFHNLAEQPITKAIKNVHNIGYKDANNRIKHRMRSAAVPGNTMTIMMIVKHLTDHLHDITENHKEEIAEKLIRHQEEQFTYDQIANDLLTFFDYDTVAASRFARTATNYVYNQAHLQRYKDTGIVPGVKYVAHLDARTSEICRMLNGTIWAVNDSNILTPPNHFNCLVAGTKILTKEGEKNIEDIRRSEYVLTHRLEYMPVTEIMQGTSTDIYNICTNNRNINITGDHPIYTRQNGYNIWTPAKNLHVYDHIITANSSIYVHETINKIKIADSAIVYNISVHRDESYVANGIIVHNCRSRIIPYYGGIPKERDYKKDFDPAFIEVAKDTLKTFREVYWKM